MPEAPPLPKIKISGLHFYPEQPPADAKAIKEIFGLWAAHRRFIILAGPPGVGKTRAAEDTIVEVLKGLQASFSQNDCRLTTLFPDFRTNPYQESEIREKLLTTGITFVWDLCVMHPQITYEDLIRGYRMVESSEVPRIEVREGILGFAARVTAILEASAKTDPLPKCVLVLDEINRAPLGQVLGEAIYALDRRNDAVATPYPLNGANSLFSLPAGLFLLGTMNSVDRAISGFDFALRRRFATVYISSEKEPIEKRLITFGPGIRKLAIKLFDEINSLVRNAKKVGVVPTAELVIGHSYFLPPPSVVSDDDALRFLAKSLLYQIIPTLMDYQEQGLVDYQTADLSDFAFADLITGATSVAALSSDQVEERLKLIDLASTAVESVKT